ncbi:MAG: hypothetical protein JNL58_15245 [Planctomyces sp.]|nr:hypothetical protein [Planctomyces sp.]
MKVPQLEDEVPSDLVNQLEEFEGEFLYPLGGASWFSISHGKDYLRFFRAMGRSVLFIAEQHGQVVGSLVLVRRTLSEFAKGTYLRIPSYYVCDFKISRRARWTRIPAMLLRAAYDLVSSEGGQSAYGIVMGGTERSPSSYTGRLGIPEFQCVGEILILRILTETMPSEASRSESTAAMASHTEYETVSTALQDEDFVRVRQRFREPSPGCDALRPEIGNAWMRSEMTPGIVTVKGDLGTGILEDTRRGKKLYLMGKSEMVSSHLSALSWTEPQWGAMVIRRALEASGSRQFPAMFCSVPATIWSKLEPYLNGLQIQISPATIYGCGLANDRQWWVNTSEI